jgi:hypothetical protein
LNMFKHPKRIVGAKRQAKMTSTAGNRAMEGGRGGGAPCPWARSAREARYRRDGLML